MITKEFSNEFALFLEGYLNFYKGFLEIEQKKYESIVKNDIKSLDNYVIAEQALLLKSRGLEVQRDRLMAQNGNETVSLKEFIPMLDESCYEKVSATYAELSDSLLDLKDINSRSNSLTELRLHKISNQIKRLEKQPELQKAYNNSAKTDIRSMNIISKKI